MAVEKVDMERLFGRMAWLCSKREYTRRDIQSKLEKKGLEKKAAEGIVARLIKEGYLSEARYARAFVRDKSILAGWGPRKIEYQLSAKGIAREDIAAAMEDFREENGKVKARQKMEAVLEAKYKSVSAATLAERKAKVLRFALTRGYDYNEILSCLTVLESKYEY